MTPRTSRLMELRFVRFCDCSLPIDVALELGTVIPVLTIVCRKCTASLTAERVVCRVMDPFINVQ